MKEDLSLTIPSWIVESSMIAAGVFNTAGQFMFANRLFEQRLPEHMLPLSESFAQRHIHADDVDKLHHILHHRSADQFPISVRRSMFCPAENFHYWVRWEFSILLDVHANVVGMVCVGSDISETIRVNSEARSFADKLETIIENITDGFCFISREWTIRRINRYGETLLDLKKGFALGRNVWDVFPQAPNGLSRRLRESMQENKSIVFEEYNEEIDKWFRAVCYPSSEGLTIIFRDVTYEKAAKRELDPMHYRLLAIYNSTTEACTFLSKDYRILYNNRVAKEICQQLFGREPQVGDDSLDYMIEPLRPEFKAYYERAINGESIVAEKTHGTRWWRFYIFPVYDPDGEIVGLAHNVQDISDSKVKEEKILAQNETLRKIAWQQSHEVRLPLAHILGLINIFEVEIKKPDNHEQIALCLAHLRKAARSLDSIIYKIVQNTHLEE